MDGCRVAADAGDEDVGSILKRGYESVESPGSSTACVLCLSDDFLRVANLGDSGFMLLRREESKFDSGDRRSMPGVQWTVTAASTEQLHSFNCPVQLGTSSSDTAECADIAEIRVERGDVALSCTDGLLDNVWENEIADLCAEAFRESDACSGDDASMLREAAETFCKMLLEKASTNANDQIKRSPFEANAKRWGFRYRGGKMDDITAIVSVVLPGGA